MRWASLAVSRPRAALTAWFALIVVLTVIGIGVEDKLSQPTFVIPGTPSGREALAERAHFGASIDFAVLLHGRASVLDQQGRRLAADLAREPHYRVVTPWQQGRAARDLRVSDTAALLLVTVDAPVKGAGPRPLDLAKRVDEIVHADVAAPVRASVTGQATIGRALEAASMTATQKAELLAAPALLLILFLVFRSVLAAAIPLVMGVATVSAGFGLLRIATSFVPIDALASSFSSMVGLALGVDYSLLMVSRFREELAARDDGSRDVVAAAATAAAATAGRTVLFAGTLLGIGMLATLWILPPGILFSASLGALLVTVLSVVAATFALPAMLVLLGPRLSARPRAVRTRRRRTTAFSRLRDRPVVAVMAGLALLALAVPAAGLRGGAPSVDELPSDSPARHDFADFSKTLGPGWSALYRITVTAPAGLTKRSVIERLDRAQTTIAHDPDVAYVAGPGSLASSARQVAALPGRLHNASARLRHGRGDARRVDSAVGQVGSGLDAVGRSLDDLRAGSSATASGSRRIDDATNQLAAALDRALAGSRRLASGVHGIASGTARERQVTRRLERGAGALRAALSRILAAVRSGRAKQAQLSASLSTGAGGLRRLRRPEQSAETEVATAIEQLQRMSVGKADPHYAAALTAVATASGYLTGRDPRTGAQADPAYAGLGPALSAASAQLDAAASGVSTSEASTDRLIAALKTARTGSARLDGGLGGLAGSVLASGARRLDGHGRQLPAALAQLVTAARRLTAGTGPLADGSSRVASGLGRESDGTRALRGGVNRLSHASARFVEAFPSSTGLHSEASPGFFRSRYALLAAVDGAGSDARAQTSFVLDLDGGGQAARLLITPKHGLDSPDAAALRARLERVTADLNGAGMTAFLGGEAAQLVDYQHSTLSKLLLLIVVLAGLNFVLLVVVLRSLLIPLASVALNLLTVGATFGAMALLFQGSAPLGGPGYLNTLALTGTFTVIFTLSLDYQVFLLARVREGFRLLGTNAAAIDYGLRRTRAVILGAAFVMMAVFAAFGVSDFIIIRQLGVGLTIAIFLDATVVRLVLLPALVRAGGERSWWIPRRIGRLLPDLDLDGAAPAPPAAV